MTNEEAKKIMERWFYKATHDTKEGQNGYLDGWFYKKDEEAFKMAIKALEFMEECEEKCKESIMRSCEFVLVDMNGKAESGDEE